jgi:transcriptional regulator with XRE-family HTH domain
LLLAARRSGRITQTELSERAKTSQAEISHIERGAKVPNTSTLERLLGSAGFSLVAVPIIAPDAPSTAAGIAVAVESGDRDRALRVFLDYSDGLSRAHGVNRIGLTITEPFPTGSSGWDAALAGIVDYWLNDEALPAPDWISDASRSLRKPATPHLSPYDLEPETSQVPAELLKRNVLIERSTLASV